MSSERRGSKLIIGTLNLSDIGSIIVGYLDSSWSARLVILITLMAIFASSDYVRNDRSLWKAREYFYLLAAGSIFAMLGALNDQITGRISMEYFHFGKGIPLGPGFLLKASWLGAKAGFMLGTFVYGIFLIISKSNRMDSPIIFRKLLLKLLIPFLFSIGMIPIITIVWYRLINYSLFADIANGLPLNQRQRFFIVWGWHIALYLGGFLGTAVAALNIRKWRSPYLNAVPAHHE